MTDEEMKMWLNKDSEKGLAMIMDAYIPYVYTICYNKAGSVCKEQDIEECVRDIFYQFFKQKDEIDLDKGSIKSYLSIIAKRRSINLFHANTTVSNDKVIVLSEDDWEFPDETKDLERSFVAKEEGQELKEKIMELGSPDSEIMLRKYFVGDSTKEIAADLNLKPNTVDKKVSRGLKKLRSMLGGGYL